MKRLLGVSFSAVLLALGSLLQIVMALAMVFSGAMMQSQIRSGGIPGATAAAPLPGWMPIYMYALGAVFVALAVWGILTTVGLFRLRRWARYSILVICGCLALFGLVSCLMILLLMFVPLPMAANMDASQAQSAQSFVKIMFGAMAFFYFLVGALGVFWLVYFNLKTVREAFAGAAGEVTASRRPFLISVIAGLLLIWVVSCLLIAFLPIPGAFFGWILYGWQKAAFYLGLAVFEAAACVGLWRLEEWGRRLALGLQAFHLVQSIVYLAHPSLMLRYSAEINRIMLPMQSPLPDKFQSMMYTVTFAFSIVFTIAIAAVLIHYRAAFQRPATPPQHENTPLM